MDIFSAILWLTLNIYHEARSEDQLSQIAVGHVVLNRSQKQGRSVKRIVLAPYQFSWVHTKDWTPNDVPALVESFQSACIAYKGFDFTGGSTYYHARKVNPYWAKKKALVATFGAHKFYRDIKLIKALKVKRKFVVKRR